MKKLLIMLMVLFSTVTAQAKCDWSTLKLQQWNQRNYYKWYVSGQVLDDTCVDYMFMMYDFQTKKVDTLNSFRGLCEVQFNKKGKYKMYLKVWNRCEKCDTALYREVNIIYFPNCKFVYNLKPTKTGGCNDSMVGEMTLGPWIKGDTCWQWYSYIWGGGMLDKLNQHDWDSMSDEQLYMYYDFNDSDIVWMEGPTNSARLIKYKFPHDGHYLIATQWYNKCLDQDTFFFTRITIDCNTSGLTPISPAVGGMIRPNPASCEFYITNTPVSYEYMILNPSGTVIATGNTSAFEQVKVNTCNWPSGIYYLWIMGYGKELIVVKH